MNRRSLGLRLARTAGVAFAVAGAWQSVGCFSDTADGTTPSPGTDGADAQTDESGVGPGSGTTSADEESTAADSTSLSTSSADGGSEEASSTEAPDETTAPTAGTTGETADASSGSTDPCTEVGCSCDASADICDDGLTCSVGVCVASVCGDGDVNGTEQCDDGNAEDGDGCDNDCSYTEIRIAAGGNQTCALIEGGRVRCWGDNRSGQLGYGNTQNVGDNEFPWQAGDVQLPSPAVEVRPGGQHVCIRTQNRGDVICWGDGEDGVLGTGNELNLGDDELPSTLSPITLGAGASSLSSGGFHNCILDTGNQVRCWGSSFQGKLGYGNNETIGDDEFPDVAGTVAIGATARQLSTGTSHTCAVLSDGRLRCWGSSTSGQLGLGVLDVIGDDEPPSVTTPLNFGVDVVKATTGFAFTCALLEDGTVRCWGWGSDGRLGRGDGSEESIGDDEPVINLDPVDLGGALAVDIASGAGHTCVLLDTHEVLCWGRNASSEVGNGTSEPVGDDETPGDVGPVILDGDVIQLECGSSHVCVVLDDYRVRCWGEAGFGRLGLGPAVQGDVADPLSVQPVQVLEPVKVSR